MIVSVFLIPMILFIMTMEATSLSEWDLETHGTFQLTQDKAIPATRYYDYAAAVVVTTTTGLNCNINIHPPAKDIDDKSLTITGITNENGKQPSINGNSYNRIFYVRADLILLLKLYLFYTNRKIFFLSHHTVI